MATTITTPTRCLRCGRILTATASITRGYGRRCSEKITTAAHAAAGTVKPAQLEKAVELIETGAIIPIRGHHVFRVIASNGIDRYTTAPQSCTCAAGLKGIHVCYHRVAATVLTAA